MVALHRLRELEFQQIAQLFLGGIRLDHLHWSKHTRQPIITIRCDTRCYFNVRSKADISQLNLPHGTDNSAVENRKTKK